MNSISFSNHKNQIVGSVKNVLLASINSLIDLWSCNPLYDAEAMISQIFLWKSEVC